MRIQLFVVSKNQAACDCAGRLKERAIPRDTLKKLYDTGARPEIRALRLKENDYDDIARSILELTSIHDDVIVLTVGDTGALDQVIAPHVLCHAINEDIRKNPKNILGSAYTQLLRRYIRVKEKYQDLGHRKMMLLPMKNCLSKELDELLKLSIFDGRHGAFSVEVDRLIARLRSRMKPKKRTADPCSYFVDDNSRHFQLGHEQHALASDACPPHKMSCVLGVHFRMGMRINRQDHFNVSKDADYISGVFEDCHDDPVLVKSTTHLNMFPNGQF